MSLSSPLFTREGPGVALLNRCAVANDGHFFQGMGPRPRLSDAVSRIQSALAQLGIFTGGDASGTYGSGTAAAVLSFKGPPRNILGPGQRTPDAIVGIQTIHRLDSEIQNQPTPPPQPLEFGSRMWRFTFFGNKGLTGIGIYSLFITSQETQDSTEYEILESSSGGELLSGFKGSTEGVFNTPRKAHSDEFAGALCQLHLVKLPFQAVLQGHMVVGTLGEVARQMTVTLPILSLPDETLGTTVTMGDFRMQGRTRQHKL